jgi:predicted nucleic acid-binding protein
LNGVTGYLLDTTALSAYYNPKHGKHAAVKAFIDAIPATDMVFVSAVAIAEINFGAVLREMDTGQPSTVVAAVLAGAHSYTIRLRSIPALSMDGLRRKLPLSTCRTRWTISFGKSG